MSDKEILEILHKLTLEEKLLLIEAISELLHTLPGDQATIPSNLQEADE